MKTFKEFEPFAKGKQLKTSTNNTCVIYTRVSTREQAENNMSLDTQRDKFSTYLGKVYFDFHYLRLTTRN